MTEQEVQRLNDEFSNQFDVLYNNITSNQAPGLDEYEKSVFFTNAQDEVVKGYFNPVLNRTQEGYDMSERRQIDFSMITKSVVYEPYVDFIVSTVVLSQAPDKWKEVPVDINESGKSALTVSPYGTLANTYSLHPTVSVADEDKVVDLFRSFIDPKHPYELITATLNQKGIRVFKPKKMSGHRFFYNPIFDLRDNTRSIIIDDDIMMMINEFVVVQRDNKDKRLNVIGITYDEYSRLMTRPYQRPTKNQAWRLIDNVDGVRTAELIVGPYDEIQKYGIRYVQRPEPIILTDLEEGLTIGNMSKANCCKLDPILFPELIQRAVELAYASYRGTINEQLALGTQSHTPLGITASSNNGQREQ